MYCPGPVSGCVFTEWVVVKWASCLIALHEMGAVGLLTVTSISTLSCTGSSRAKVILQYDERKGYMLSPGAESHWFAIYTGLVVGSQP